MRGTTGFVYSAYTVDAHADSENSSSFSLHTDVNVGAVVYNSYGACLYNTPETATHQ